MQNDVFACTSVTEVGDVGSTSVLQQKGKKGMKDSITFRQIHSPISTLHTHHPILKSKPSIYRYFRAGSPVLEQEAHQTPVGGGKPTSSSWPPSPPTMIVSNNTSVLVC
jgi:hypothetical protein